MRDEEKFGGFPKIRGTFLGVPIIIRRIKCGPYMGVPLFWETTILHHRLCEGRFLNP